MYPIVSVLADARPVNIVFADEASAQSFLAFVSLYIMESGAGNGYGAYWHFGEEPTYSKKPRVCDALDISLIHDMSWSICLARLATDDMEVVRSGLSSPHVKTVQGMWSFGFNPDELPPRQTPAAGEMCRVVDCDQEDFNRRDARVVAIRGDQADINFGWGDKETHTVKLNALMKIFDYEKRR